MKKLLCIVPLACAMLASAGCKEKIIQRWDYPSEEIVIYVEDDKGNDMLSAITDGSLFNNTIRAEYDGKSYTAVKVNTRAGSEPTLPVFKGLEYHLRSSGQIYLTLGEFSIDTRDYLKEKFSIDWGDGTRSEFEFDLWHTDNGDNAPIATRAIRVTGGTGHVSATPILRTLIITVTKNP